MFETFLITLSGSRYPTWQTTAFFVLL